MFGFQVRNCTTVTLVVSVEQELASDSLARCQLVPMRVSLESRSPCCVWGDLFESACRGDAYWSCEAAVIVAYRCLKVACSDAVCLGKIVANGSVIRSLDKLPLACIIDGISAIDRGTVHRVGPMNSRVHRERPMNGSVARRNGCIVRINI